MTTPNKKLLLYRTVWKNNNSGTYPFSLSYISLGLQEGFEFEIKMITSCSLTLYKNDEDLDRLFYIYEITVPKGLPILSLEPLLHT